MNFNDVEKHKDIGENEEVLAAKSNNTHNRLVNILPFAALLVLVCVSAAITSTHLSTDADNTEPVESAAAEENLAEPNDNSSVYVGNMQFFSDFSADEETKDTASSSANRSVTSLAESSEDVHYDTDTDTDSDTNTDTDEDVLTEDDFTYIISDFPIIYQMPELPTGCEVTALAMVLSYYGFDVDKVELATEYLPTLYSAETYYGSDGLIYGNDLNQYFLGDPQTENGYVCGTGAIVTAADLYLANCGSSMTAVDLSGTDPEYLYEFISRDTPVLVWCTIDMAERTVVDGWYTENGDYVDYATNDHGAVLIGYSDTKVIIADPIAGRVIYDRERFENVFLSRSKRCVILR